MAERKPSHPFYVQASTSAALTIWQHASVTFQVVASRPFHALAASAFSVAVQREAGPQDERIAYLLMEEEARVPLCTDDCANHAEETEELALAEDKRVPDHAEEANSPQLADHTAVDDDGSFPEAAAEDISSAVPNKCMDQGLPEELDQGLPEELDARPVEPRDGWRSFPFCWKGLLPLAANYRTEPDRH